MMRKVIWCGTALLACGTIAATMAAYYVAENPDSVLSQGTMAAWDICAWFNPALALNRVPVPCDKPCPAAMPWMAHEEGPLPEPQEPPMPEVGEVPQIAVSDPNDVTGQVTQPPEPIVVEDISLPVVQETQEPAIEGEQQVPFMNPSDETGLDDVPAFMPYADDDDAVLHAAQMKKPDLMTQLLGCFMNQDCTSEELGCAVFAQAVAEFLKELVGDDSETTVVPVAPDEPVEDSNPETPPTEAFPYPLEDIQEQPETQTVGAAVGAVVGTSTVTENVPVGAVPTDPTYPVGEGNPSPDIQDSNPPEAPNYTGDSNPPNPENTNLQEDPNYHHQYPSCPYTGQCPYTGHCPYPYHYNVPSVPHTETVPQPEIAKPKKPAKNKPAQPVQPPAKPTKPVQKIDPMLDLETFGVDTMECRPSDVSDYLPGAGPF
jgi:hypothetical protein